MQTGATDRGATDRRAVTGGLALGTGWRLMQRLGVGPAPPPCSRPGGISSYTAVLPWAGPEKSLKPQQVVCEVGLSVSSRTVLSWWPSLRDFHVPSPVPAYGLAGLEGHGQGILEPCFPVPGLPPRSVRPPQLDNSSFAKRSVCRPPLPALPASSRSGAGPALVDYPWGAERLHRLFVQQPLLPTDAQGQGGKDSTGRCRFHLEPSQEWLFLSEPGHRHQASLPPVSFSWAFGSRAVPQLMDPTNQLGSYLCP